MEHPAVVLFTFLLLLFIISVFASRDDSISHNKVYSKGYWTKLSVISGISVEELKTLKGIGIENSDSIIKAQASHLVNEEDDYIKENSSTILKDSPNNNDSDVSNRSLRDAAKFVDDVEMDRKMLGSSTNVNQKNHSDFNRKIINSDVASLTQLAKEEDDIWSKSKYNSHTNTDSSTSESNLLQDSSTQKTDNEKRNNYLGTSTVVAEALHQQIKDSVYYGFAVIGKFSFNDMSIEQAKGFNFLPEILKRYLHKLLNIELHNFKVIDMNQLKKVITLAITSDSSVQQISSIELLKTTCNGFTQVFLKDSKLIPIKSCEYPLTYTYLPLQNRPWKYNVKIEKNNLTMTKLTSADMMLIKTILADILWISMPRIVTLGWCLDTNDLHFNILFYMLDAIGEFVSISDSFNRFTEYSRNADKSGVNIRVNSELRIIQISHMLEDAVWPRDTAPHTQYYQISLSFKDDIDWTELKKTYLLNHLAKYFVVDEEDLKITSILNSTTCQIQVMELAGADLLLTSIKSLLDDVSLKNNINIGNTFIISSATVTHYSNDQTISSPTLSELNIRNPEQIKLKHDLVETTIAKVTTTESDISKVAMSECNHDSSNDHNCINNGNNNNDNSSQYSVDKIHKIIWLLVGFCVTLVVISAILSCKDYKARRTLVNFDSNTDRALDFSTNNYDKSNNSYRGYLLEEEDADGVLL